MKSNKIKTIKRKIFIGQTFRIIISIVTFMIGVDILNNSSALNKNTIVVIVFTVSFIYLFYTIQQFFILRNMNDVEIIKNFHSCW